MSFSCRNIKALKQSLPLLPVIHTEYVPDERGICHLERFDDADLRLPDLKSYDLELMLKAGVPLQETRTDIVMPDVKELNNALDNELLEYKESINE